MYDTFLSGCCDEVCYESVPGQLLADRDNDP